MATATLINEESEHLADFPIDVVLVIVAPLSVIRYHETAHGDSRISAVAFK